MNDLNTLIMEQARAINFLTYLYVISKSVMFLAVAYMCIMLPDSIRSRMKNPWSEKD